jgi:hypothetical protein
VVLLQTPKREILAAALAYWPKRFRTIWTKAVLEKLMTWPALTPARATTWFSRTIIGPSAARTRAGGRRLPPEVTFQTYIKSNPGVTLARVRQLQDMAEWADTQGLKNYMNEAAAGGESIFTTIDNTIDSYLRGLREVASRDVFDPSTGQTRTVINAQALDDWKSKNENLLELFPQLRLDLADAASTQRTLDMFRVTEKRGKRDCASAIILVAAY